ncbi:MAG: YbjN domain-containing protein [Desulfatibacillaceae bacterium]|nr:YbjN domain-containing protein [Desulfatibacillaceae bacterium]
MAYWFEQVKKFAEKLGLQVTQENPQTGLLLVEDRPNGIMNCLIDAGGEILVIEQAVAMVPIKKREQFYAFLLTTNRILPHGAFVVDSREKIAYFRDTHRFDKLQPEMIEDSLRSLEWFLTNHGPELAKLLRDDQTVGHA